MSLNELCRACLVHMESFTYYLIDNVPPEIYLYCTAIEIKQEENLPRALCDICYDLLNKFFDFKQKCVQSQNTLLDYNFIKPEVTTNYADLISIEHIKSENSCNNINTKKEFSESHGFLDKINNTKLEEDSKDLLETDNSHCSLDNYSNKQELNKDILIKQEDINGSINFIEGFHVPDLAHKPEINSTKKIRKSLKRRIKHGAVKTTAKLKHTKEYFSCDLCEKIFYSTTTYEFHRLTHSSKELSIQCSACTKTFMTLSGLRRHLQSSHITVDLKSLKCEVCGKISKSKEALKMHLKTHGDRQLFVCDTCGKSSTSAYSFKAHLETHKEKRERTFTCEHCGKKFFTNNMLVLHASRRHTGRRFVCDICNYPFTAKSNLVKHLLLHEGKKLYKCNICQKSFAAKSTLVEHERIHSGERPFACNYCPKSFLSKRRLMDHHRIHTGEKPYKCDLCDQAFTQCGTLNRHMKVHERSVPVA